jgi:hypothetical protein
MQNRDWSNFASNLLNIKHPFQIFDIKVRTLARSHQGPLYG